MQQSMPTSRTRRGSPPRRLLSAAAILAAAQLAAVALLADDANAGKVRVLGAAKSVDASCPDDCVVEARVTGFQTRIGARKRPFRVPAAGRIVAWSIKLGNPAQADRQFFNERFGASQARISILKPIKIRNKRGRVVKTKYRLLRQSPLQGLQPFFGTTTTFGLQRSLKVRKGNIVALTMPTWAPAFSVAQPGRWRASRVPSKKRGPCTTKKGFANLNAGAAHMQKGTQRRYGCVYKGARLLYTARFIRNAKRSG